MGSTCTCDNGSSCAPDDVTVGEIKNRLTDRNTSPQTTRKLPSDPSIASIDIPALLDASSNSTIALDEASVLNDLGLFGVDNDTMRLLLTLEDISINDDLRMHSVDIPINVSPIKSTTFHPKTSDKEEAETPDLSNDESSDYSHHELFPNERLEITRDMLNPKQRTSHLIKSNDLWESEDYDDLETEMKKEYNHLSERSSHSGISSGTRTSTLLAPPHDMNGVDACRMASLFRLQSADKWDEDEIDSRINEMQDEINSHVQTNHNVL
eukprot:118746_1